MSFIRNHERQPTSLSVVGLKGAGAWVAAARAQAGTAIDRASVDVTDFRFEKIASQQHVDFVPGAVKYGDLPALLALSAPYRMQVLGLHETDTKAVQAAYQTSDSHRQLTAVEGSSEEPVETAIDWLLRGDRSQH